MNNKRKILLIEDEYFISELYHRALTRAGYEIKMISDGNEALKEALTNQYDIILLDLMIPNLNGSDILNILRDKSKIQDLKARIIVTTNLEQRPEIKKQIEDKADAYLIKAELTPGELVAFLENIK
jgi:DNA-binding response OmpR family regulator